MTFGCVFLSARWARIRASQILLPIFSRYQGSIDFNTVNIHRTVGMYFLVSLATGMIAALEIALGQSHGPRGAKSLPLGSLLGLEGCIFQYIPPLSSVRIHYKTRSLDVYTIWSKCSNAKMWQSFKENQFSEENNRLSKMNPVHWTDCLDLYRIRISFLQFVESVVCTDMFQWNFELIEISSGVLKQSH